MYQKQILGTLQVTVCVLDILFFKRLALGTYCIVHRKSEFIFWSVYLRFFNFPLLDTAAISISQVRFIQSC